MSSFEKFSCAMYARKQSAFPGSRQAGGLPHHPGCLPLKQGWALKVLPKRNLNTNNTDNIDKKQTLRAFRPRAFYFPSVLSA
jgi:hypothetical protein